MIKTISFNPTELEILKTVLSRAVCEVEDRFNWSQLADLKDKINGN